MKLKHKKNSDGFLTKCNTVHATVIPPCIGRLVNKIFTYDRESKVRNKNHKLLIKVNIKSLNLNMTFNLLNCPHPFLTNQKPGSIWRNPVWTKVYRTLYIEYHPGFYCHACSIRVKSFVMHIGTSCVHPSHDEYMVLYDPKWPQMTTHWPLSIELPFLAWSYIIFYVIILGETKVP